MADEVTTLTVKGEGGDVFKMDVPADGTERREIFDTMLAKGQLVIVEGDYTPAVVEPVVELDDDLDADVEAVEQPPRNGSTEAWQAYAVAQGADPADIEGMGRDELVATFASED